MNSGMTNVGTIIPPRAERVIARKTESAPIWASVFPTAATKRPKPFAARATARETMAKAKRVSQAHFKEDDPHREHQGDLDQIDEVVRKQFAQEQDGVRNRGGEEPLESPVPFFLEKTGGQSQDDEEHPKNGVGRDVLLACRGMPVRLQALRG